jgi:hypothetical protein
MAHSGIKNPFMATIDSDSEFIYTKLMDEDRFDPLQKLIVEICDITGQYYEPIQALEIRIELEGFLRQIGNPHFLEIHLRRRTVQEPDGTLEQGVFLLKV